MMIMSFVKVALSNNARKKEMASRFILFEEKLRNYFQRVKAV